MQIQLGIQQLSIDSDFKPPAIGRDQFDLFDQMLIVLEQFICQAHGPTGVVSDRTINDLYFQHNPSADFGDYIIEAIRARMQPPFHRQASL